MEQLTRFEAVDVCDDITDMLTVAVPAEPASTETLRWVKTTGTDRYIVWAKDSPPW